MFPLSSRLTLSASSAHWSSAVARTLLAFSPLSGLGARSPPLVASGHSRLFASRVWTSLPGKQHQATDDDHDLEDVEDKLQTVVDKVRKSHRTVKYHILRRKLTPSGAPGRKLTWEAIEQIRYLKQEQPEEWTVERLAEGFSVTPDVILRVLRSKFIPASERRAKQDAKVMAIFHEQVLPAGGAPGQQRLKAPGNQTTTLLGSGSGGDALVPVADQTSIIAGTSSASLAKRSAPIAALPVLVSNGNPVTVRSTEEKATNTNPTETREEEECWDGQVLSEEDLKEFMEMEPPPPPVQIGKEFFDSKGTFLYRI